MSDGTRDDLTPPPMATAWVVQEVWEIGGTEGDESGDAPACGIINERAVWGERYRQWKQRAPGDTQVGGFRYDHFAPAPRYVGLSSFAPDWVEDNGLQLASPRLFALLDQPAGSLQGIPAETEWLGPDAPDWSYLWLAYLPIVPALDLEHCEGESKWITRGGEQMEVLNTFPDALLRLRDGFVPPCGLFTPAESTPLRMASDAVAEAVLRAGCTGIEFRHPEAAFIIGRWFRRSVDGVELHPRDVALLEDQDDPEPYTLPDMGLPPIGPPLRWDQSALDLVDWEVADKELRAAMTDYSNSDKTIPLTLLLGTMSDDEDSVQQLLADVEDMRAGHTNSRSHSFCTDVIVTVRPDAVWIWDKYAYPEKQLRPLPLDDAEAVLRRWAEAIQHPSEDQGS